MTNEKYMKRKEQKPYLIEKKDSVLSYFLSKKKKLASKHLERVSKYALTAEFDVT